MSLSVPEVVEGSVVLSKAEKVHVLYVLRKKIQSRYFRLHPGCRDIAFVVVSIWCLLCFFSILYFSIQLDVTWKDTNSYEEAVSAFTEKCGNNSNNSIWNQISGEEWFTGINEELWINYNITQREVLKATDKRSEGSLQYVHDTSGVNQGVGQLSFGFSDNTRPSHRFLFSVFFAYMLSLLIWQPIILYLFAILYVYWDYSAKETGDIILSEAYFFADSARFVSEDDMEPQDWKELEELGYRVPEKHCYNAGGLGSTS